MRAKFEFGLEASVKKEGKWYISSCEALDIHSQGMTESKAVSNLAEALKLFVESCWERGTLDEVLKASGFTPVKIEGKRESRSRQLIINVPLSLISRQNAPAHAH